MPNIELIAGSGFFFEKKTQYLIRFSENKHHWSMNSFKHILILPPFDSLLFHEILRHEVQHVLFYNFFKRNKFLYYIWYILFAEFFFEGFEELWISYKSKSMRGYFHCLGNMFQLAYSFFLLFLIIYGIFYSLTLLSVLFGALTGIFLVERIGKGK